MSGNAGSIAAGLNPATMRPAWGVRTAVGRRDPRTAAANSSAEVTAATATSGRRPAMRTPATRGT